ncbi:hypothetical protein [Lederbergia lenta]|uniref:Co-sigma factor n=1 Tax=Lederbergia lenta TaxID=1467 RepID=A0A2X4ZQM6_LEDLE|nr:hypothetical protein [Lederbergia lenta]MEC2323086.1 hypothetical protein [Lederbergia lenta]SQI62684.1 co-sigma factor [Lederbergia lenta]
MFHKKDESTKEIIEIIDDFNSKIKKSLSNTTYQDRDDLEQEIKLKIIEKLYTVEFNDPPSFWKLTNL